MKSFHCYSSFPSSSPPPLAEGWCQSLGVLNLTHLAVDRGSIYLAGGNILYQLDQVAFKLDETSNMVLYKCKREL